MLYLFYGTDYQKARAQYKAAILQAKQKHPQAHVVAFDEASVSFDDSIDKLAHPQLFPTTRIIILDEINDIPEWELTPARAQVFAQSDDIVFAVAKSFPKKTITAAEQAGGKIYECKKVRTIGKPKRKTSNDRFALTDSFARKDKKQSWILYRKLIDEKVVPEEIHGLLVWQLKALLLASQCSSAGQAGLNPFVYKKAQRFLPHWSEEDLLETYKKFIELYHDSHRGITELETALEKFLLR